jgi:tRNA A-37 threonylcarbamoyl transferase component Bud32/tetratricopeptide (TPR) repeat protein
MTNCPSDASLRLIGTEAVGDVTFAALEGHIEQCPDCQKILEAAANAVPLATHSAPAGSTLPMLPGLVIERELGRGGASVVYLAWEQALNRHVAVKLFPRNSLVDPHAREHWLREARALSRVPHDHVVAIHRVDETEEWLWLVIEYVSGGTLKDRLTEPLLPREAARLTETIARAVGYFHTRGVCHLDLKPSNILLDGEPRVPWEIVSPKISDFGIARLEGEPGTTETGANGPKGTPSYMAPEQVAALPGTIGPAADIYALGAMLYHLLTGRPPFQGASTAETLDQVRNQEPVPPRRLNGRIPRDLETICLTCMEKAPNRRYATALALAGDLRLWLEGHPIKARPVSPIGQAWRLCRRHPALATLLATLALTLATGVVGLFVLLKQTAAERARFAEARRNAEAYEQFSASAADQLLLFLGAIFPVQRSTTPDQMKAAVLKLRNSINELKGAGIVASSFLGIFEEKIGSALMQLSETEEARDLLNQAVADLTRSLRKSPEDREVRHFLALSLFYSGSLAQEANQPKAAMNHFEQAATVQLVFEPSDSDYWFCTKLYKRLQILTDRLGQTGQAAEQERSRHLGQRILQRLLGSELAGSNPASAPGLEMLALLFQPADPNIISSHDNKGNRVTNEFFVAEWLALSVGPLSPFRSSPSCATYDQDPEGGAIALIAAIRDRCSKLGLADSMVLAAIDVVRDDAVVAAAEQRRLGRLDDARATAARLLVLARRLVCEYPESADSYRALSEAYDQIKKNAFRTRDDTLVEEAIVKAIEAAQRAVALDPGRVEIRHNLKKLTDQLASIKADRSAMSAALPHSPR